MLSKLLNGFSRKMVFLIATHIGYTENSLWLLKVELMESAPPTPLLLFLCWARNMNANGTGMVFNLYKHIVLYLGHIETVQTQIRRHRKQKFTGHWLRYNTTPNVLTLSTQSSQAKKLELSNFAETFTRSMLMF